MKEKLSKGSWKKAEGNSDRIFGICFVLILFLQIWKAHISPGIADEHFYATLGWRLYQGDALFFDDWHIAQMISVFNLPVILINRLLHGDNTGIILTARYCYVAYTMFIGSLLYNRFRSRGISAVIASSIYMLFTPLSMMGMSYNVMNIGFMTLALLAWPKNDTQKERSFLVGVLMACAVLCSPFLIFLYVFLTAMTFIKEKIMPRKIWIWMTAGALCVAAVFAIIVLSRASFQEILLSLPYLIDPSHSGRLMSFIRNGGKLVLSFHLFLIAMLVELILAWKWRKETEEKKQKLLGWSFAINLLAMIQVCFFPVYESVALGTWCESLIPFAFTGLLGLILYPVDSYVISLYLASIVLMLVIMFSTNVGPRTFASPLILACSMTPFIFQNHLEKTGKLFVGGFLFLLVWFRIFGLMYAVYEPSQYTLQLQEGPLKGLYASETYAQDYQEKCADMKELDAMEGDHYMIITYEPWEYFIQENKRIASISTYLYLTQEDQFIKAQDEYMEMHPDKLPVYVYLDTPHPYEMRENDPWLQQFTKVKEMKQGTLYLRKAQ